MTRKPMRAISKPAAGIVLASGMLTFSAFGATAALADTPEEPLASSGQSSAEQVQPQIFAELSKAVAEIADVTAEVVEAEAPADPVTEAVVVEADEVAPEDADEIDVAEDTTESEETAEIEATEEDTAAPDSKEAAEKPSAPSANKAKGSGVDWGFDPAEHPQISPDSNNSWGGYGESIGTTYWRFQWFMNYTDKDQVITGYDMTQDGGFGETVFSTCKLPLVIPAGGSATCEISYEMDSRDADFIRYNIVWLGDNGLELESSFRVKTTNKPTEPTKPVETGEGGNDDDTKPGEGEGGTTNPGTGGGNNGGGSIIDDNTTVGPGTGVVTDGSGNDTPAAIDQTFPVHKGETSGATGKQPTSAGQLASTGGTSVGLFAGLAVAILAAGAAIFGFNTKQR